MKSIKHFLKESSLSRVYEHYLKHETGTITAYRKARDCNEGVRYKKAELKQRNKILSAKLLKLGYGITKLKGTFIENFGSANEKKPVKEESFFVVDINDTGKLRKDLIRLGTTFEQDSITFSEVGPNGKYLLISSNTCEFGYPGFGKIGVVETLGGPMFSKTGEMSSKVNGRPFVFESAVSDFVHDFNSLDIRSRYAVSLLAEEEIDLACEVTINNYKGLK